MHTRIADMPLVDAKQAIIDLGYLRTIHAAALSFSKDPRTRVSAMILGADKRSCSMGYNGMAVGVDETELWADYQLKIDNVIHAEENAIINCPFPKQGATIYCTLCPCGKCLPRIINAGITRVVHYGPPWERDPHLDSFERHKHLIEIVRYDDDFYIDAYIATSKIGGKCGDRYVGTDSTQTGKHPVE